MILDSREKYNRIYTGENRYPVSPFGKRESKRDFPSPPGCRIRFGMGEKELWMPDQVRHGQPGGAVYAGVTRACFRCSWCWLQARMI
jgi:hypothetical protein